MPINKPSTKVFFDDERLRIRFKQLVAELQTSMTRRLEAFIRFDVNYWERTGQPFKIDDFNESDTVKDSTDLTPLINKALSGDALNDCEVSLLAEGLGMTNPKDLFRARNKNPKHGDKKNGHSENHANCHN
jgi:hypothetical protein